MKRSRYSDEQIAYALRQAESRTAAADYAGSWASARRRSMFGKRSTNVGVTELRQLREENAKLKAFSGRSHTWLAV